VANLFHLRRADAGQELVDLAAQHLGLAAELARRSEHLRGGFPGLAGGIADPADDARDLPDRLIGKPTEITA